MAQVFTILELAKEVGGDITPRTIRYYIAEGLLPKPDERGQYTPGHLRRLQLIRRYREAFVPLDKIRSQLVTLTDEQVAERLDETGSPTETADTAAAYTARLLAGYPNRHAVPAPAQRPVAPPVVPDLQETVTLHRRLKEQTSAAKPSLSVNDSSGETWERKQIAPGVELHVQVPLPRTSEEVLQTLLAFIATLPKPPQ